MAELVLDAKAILGESPCWDIRSNILYWVDIERYQVHMYNPESKEDRVIYVGGPVGNVVPRESDGGLFRHMTTVKGLPAYTFKG